MANSYIPTRDTDLDDWLANFSTLLTASPGTYGLLSADASIVATAVSAWHAAYLLAINPVTRTPVAVQGKDDAKINVLTIVRPYAVSVSLNAGVLTSDKIALGVNPRTSPPTPIGAPTTAPVISLVGSNFLTMTLRFRDEGAPSTSRSKPPGVLQMQLFGATSATVISDPAVLPLMTVATKIPVVLNWDSGNRGKTAYLAARWITRRGLVGPWSSIESYIVG